MSETSTGLVGSADTSKAGPDYFTYYTRQIKELLSQDEDFLPFASELTGNRCGEVRSNDTIEHNRCNGSFFSNNVGVGLSDYKKERLNALLRQTVAALTPEVDEMLDPVVKMCWLQSQVRHKKFASEHKQAVSEGDAEPIPNKKLKMSSPSSSTSNSALASPVSSGSCREGSASKCMDSKHLDVALPGQGMSNVAQNQKYCTRCSTTETTEWVTDLEGKFLCNNCGISGKSGSESHLGSNTCNEKGNEEGNDDLQFLLENNDSLLVEEMVKKYSDELCATLDHMEKQLEELLDTVVSTCRPMTLSEKQQLQKLIQKLPPTNLNRVVELVQRNKPMEIKCCDEIFVNLEQEDNVTLQRLYYYVDAVAKARTLSLSISNSNVL